MNLFDKLFKKRKKQSAYYIKLHKSLLKNGFKNEVKNAYFLLGIPNTSANLTELKKAIFANSFKQLKEEIQYDVSLDNLELYLIEDIKSNHYLITLLDPYELLESEQILEIKPITYKEFDFEPELIFSST